MVAKKMGVTFSATPGLFGLALSQLTFGYYYRIGSLLTETDSLFYLESGLSFRCPAFTQGPPCPLATLRRVHEASQHTSSFL